MSGKYQGKSQEILRWMVSGNPVILISLKLLSELQKLLFLIRQVVSRLCHTVAP